MNLVFKENRIFLSLFILAMFFGAAYSSAQEWDNADLYKIQKVEANNHGPAWIQKENKRELEDLANLQIIPALGRRDGITYDEMNKLIQSMHDHEVVGHQAAEKYKSLRRFVKIGYCFGRATYAHIALLHMGVNPDSIRKVFIVGPMKSGGVNWGFHVTTVVRSSEDGRWYSVDRFTNKPQLIEDWFSRFQKMNSNGTLRAYVTLPERFSPNDDMYDRLNLGLDIKRKSEDWYRHFFQDLMASFKPERKTLEKYGLQTAVPYPLGSGMCTKSMNNAIRKHTQSMRSKNRANRPPGPPVRTTNRSLFERLLGVFR